MGRGGGGDSKAPKPTHPQKLVSPRILATSFWIIFRTWFLHRSSGSIRSPTPGSRWSCQLLTPPPHTYAKSNAALLRKGGDNKITMWVDLIPTQVPNSYLPTYLRYTLHVSRTAKNGGDRQVRSKLRGAKRNHSKLIHWEIKQIKQNIHRYLPILYLKQATEEPFSQSRRVATTTTASIYNLTEYIHVCRYKYHGTLTM